MHPSAAVSPRIERELPSRGLDANPGLGLVPEKRDVQEFIVSCTARDFAQGFAELLRDPAARFGLLRVKRPRARVGLPFEAGERFQGGFDLRLTIEEATTRWRGAWRRPVLRALETAFAAALLERVEESCCSDFAEVESIEMEPAGGDERWRLVYRYLEGTPITGHTEYTVEPEVGGRCRVTQTFVYREVNVAAWLAFQAVGLRLHNVAVYWQVRGAAERAGGRIESATTGP